ncbi:cytochrome P450 [Cyathus striatus]|nr:cytochrome P450 [Cyathus striatus]
MSAIIPSFALVLLLALSSNSDDRLPPGPPRTFIIGNILQISANFPQLKFTQWAREYGDIISLKIFNQTFIVLSSARAVRLVLDKHGTSTGNKRPAYTNAISTGNPHFVNHNIDSEYWKNARKAVHAFFTPEALRNYRDTQQMEYVQLLHDLMESPSHCPQLAGSEAEVYFEMVRLRILLAEPKAHPPLDALPFLKWVPARWARWKRLARHCAALRIKLQNGLLSECEDRMKSGRDVGCYMESVLKNRDMFNMTWREISGLGGVLLDGGIETTAAFIQSFVVILLNYPEVQERAQKEIDLKIGSDKLPTLEDVADVPYIKALIKELLEYTIPKNATILMNTCKHPRVGIFHDPDMFDEPDTFNPERYLISEFGTKPGIDASSFRHNFQFGGGRRLCPGEHFAIQSSELLTAFLLWAFTFSKDESSTGGIDLDSYVRPGVELIPLPFTCNVTLREESRGDVIREMYRQLQGLEERRR